MSRLTAPPFRLDTRIAESPIVGMRFLLDSRATDLGQLIEELDAAEQRLIQRRSILRQQLRTVDESWRDQLTATPPRRRRLEAGAAAQIELCSELSVIEEQLSTCLCRIDELRQETATLHQVSAALLPVGQALAGPVDEDARRYAVAARQLLALVDEDQRAVVDSILDGPVQLLSDAVAGAELAGRLIADGDQEQVASELSASCAALSGAHQASVRLVSQLRPPLITEGLAAVLRRELRGVEGPATRCDVIGNEHPLAGSMELTLHRIATEAIDNALRHSRADHIEVVLSYHRERTVLVVRDDGEGFDIAATEARLGRTRSLGLISMRERASLEGGLLEVRSMLGMGTEVRASFGH